jgi:hypothetical protein
LRRSGVLLAGCQSLLAVAGLSFSRYASRNALVHTGVRLVLKTAFARFLIWPSASNRLMRGLDTPQAGQLDDGWPA